MIRFAERTRWRTEKNRITHTLEAKRSRGESIVDLTASNPTRLGFHYLSSELLQEFLNIENLSYEPDPLGPKGARKTIVRYYEEQGIKLHESQIILTASTSEAYAHLFKLLVNPMGVVLTPRPSYPLIEHLGLLSDIELQPYPLIYRSGWSIDESAWESMNRGQPQAILVINPNNPTGHYIHKSQKDWLIEQSKRCGAPIISDEVFLDYPFGDIPQGSGSFAACSETLVFSLGGISKILALPQMKLSWIAVNGPEELRHEAIQKLEMISDTFLSVNTPAAHALGTWMKRRDAIQSEIRGRIRENLKWLQSALSGLKELKLLEAEGGWYAVLKHNIGSDEELSLRLLEKKNIHTHPGYFYDFESGNHQVISLIVRPHDFREGVTQLMDEI